MGRLTSACIWESSVGAFICCSKQFNQADNPTSAPSPLIPQWPAEIWRVDGRYDTPLYSLTCVWSSYLSVLLPLFPPLPHGSISLLGHLRQSGGVDWSTFRLPDPSFPFSSTQILPNIYLLSTPPISLPSLTNPLPSFPLQSL